MAQKFSVNITPEITVEINKFSALGFSPREVAIMLELDIDFIVFECENDKSEVYRAYHGGRLQREHDLHEKIFKLADSGSSPAQTMALDILKKQKIKMLDR